MSAGGCTIAYSNDVAVSPKEVEQLLGQEYTATIPKSKVSPSLSRSETAEGAVSCSSFVPLDCKPPSL